MKCHACGIKNDSKAKFCMNCGNRLQENLHGYRQDDEYEIISPKKDDRDHDIYCPKCGSNNIHFVTIHEGSDYDAENACCGYILFGPFGLLCGLFSDKKTSIVRKCMKCGREF